MEITIREAMETEEPRDRPEILKPAPWWRVFMKLKINPLYAFIIIAASLAGALWFGRGKTPEAEIKWKVINTGRLSAEVPADLVEIKEGLSGIHYLIGGDGDQIAVIALLPAPQGSEIRRAIKEGTPRVAEAFLRLFPLEGIGNLDCRLDPQRKSYELSGIRRKDPRAVCGSVWLVPDLEEAVVVMTSARLSPQAKALCERVRDSVKIKPGSE